MQMELETVGKALNHKKRYQMRSGNGGEAFPMGVAKHKKLISIACRERRLRNKSVRSRQDKTEAISSRARTNITPTSVSTAIIWISESEKGPEASHRSRPSITG